MGKRLDDCTPEVHVIRVIGARRRIPLGWICSTCKSLKVGANMLYTFQPGRRYKCTCSSETNKFSDHK